MKEDYKAIEEKRAKLKQPSKVAAEFGDKLVKAIVWNLNHLEDGEENKGMKGVS